MFRAAFLHLCCIEPAALYHFFLRAVFTAYPLFASLLLPSCPGSAGLFSFLPLLIIHVPAKTITDGR